MTTFDLEWRELGGPSTLVEGIPDTHYELTGLAPGADYQWRVRAVEGDEAGDWSEWQAFTTRAAKEASAGVQASTSTAASANRQRLLAASAQAVTSMAATARRRRFVQASASAGAVTSMAVAAARRRFREASASVGASTAASVNEVVILRVRRASAGVPASSSASAQPVLTRAASAAAPATTAVSASGESRPAVPDEYLEQWTGVALGQTPENITRLAGDMSAYTVTESPVMPEGVGLRPNSGIYSVVRWDTPPDDTDEQEVLAAIDYPSHSTSWADGFGVALRLQSTGNGYFFLLRNTTGIPGLSAVIGTSPSSISVIAEEGFTSATSGLFVIRAQATGSTLRMKVWPADEREPTEWTVTGTNNSHPTGAVGFRHSGGHNFVAGPVSLGINGVRPPRIGFTVFTNASTDIRAVTQVSARGIRTAAAQAGAEAVSSARAGSGRIVAASAHASAQSAAHALRVSRRRITSARLESSTEARALPKRERRGAFSIAATSGLSSAAIRLRLLAARVESNAQVRASARLIRSDAASSGARTGSEALAGIETRGRAAVHAETSARALGLLAGDTSLWVQAQTRAGAIPARTRRVAAQTSAESTAGGERARRVRSVSAHGRSAGDALASGQRTSNARALGTSRTLALALGSRRRWAAARAEALTRGFARGTWADGDAANVQAVTDMVARARAIVVAKALVSSSTDASSRSIGGYLHGAIHHPADDTQTLYRPAEGTQALYRPATYN